MPRRKLVAKREITPDSRYNSVLVSKFINGIMEKGKKSIALKIFYNAMDIMEEKITEEGPMEVFEKAMDNVRPKVEVKSRRVGGATYQVPVEVHDVRGMALAMRWIIMFARKRSEKSMALKLTGELLDSFNMTGSSFKKKDDTHKMAEANKAFSHFRW